MQETEIQDYARQLFAAHGDKAIVEAAQRHIEAALKLMRGPKQS
jgi:hypothetical protein